MRPDKAFENINHFRFCLLSVVELVHGMSTLLTSEPKIVDQMIDEVFGQVPGIGADVLMPDGAFVYLRLPTSIVSNIKPISCRRAKQFAIGITGESFSSMSPMKAKRIVGFGETPVGTVIEKSIAQSIAPGQTVVLKKDYSFAELVGWRIKEHTARAGAALGVNRVVLVDSECMLDLQTHTYREIRVREADVVPESQ